MNDRTTESALRGTIDRKSLLEHAWLDRDLGWLAFNERVLHEAFDERTPLLERLKFLAIVTSNLDEFFMKRVGMFRGKALIEDREDPLSREGDARTRLLAIRAIVLKMLDDQAACYKALLPLLASHGILIATWEQLSPAQTEEASTYFDSHVSPALTPLSFDPAHPFPFMSNLSTNWAFVIASEESIEPRIVRVKIPPELPAWFELKADVPTDQRRFLALEELIYRSAHKLLPGMTIISGTLFRILRNAEMDLEDDEGESLRDAVTDAVQQRRFEPVVRVDFGPERRPGRASRADGAVRIDRSRRVRAAGHAQLPGSVSRSPRSTFPPCAIRPGFRSRSRDSPSRNPTSLLPSMPATSSFTIRTRASIRASSGSFTRRPMIPGRWRSR